MMLRAVILLAAWLSLAAGVAELFERRDVLLEMGLTARRRAETLCFPNPIPR
jgi:hypothetical protein